MPTIEPGQKFYVRVDKSGRPIPSSGVYRKSMPKTGRWVELESAACCAALELRATPADLTDTSFVITVLCDATEILQSTVTADEATVDIEDILHLLRVKAKQFGKWSVDGTEIVLQLSANVSINCEDSEDLSLTIV
jgi:hypothetical protein